MEIDALKQAGLTKNQAIIYVTLLKLGETSAQQIIRESKLHRSRVYDSLDALENQGIVSSVTKDFKKYFQAISPEKLVDFIDEKKEALKRAIPELMQLKGTKKEKVNASLYAGPTGLKAIHLEMLKEGKNIYVMGAKGIIFSEFPYFIPNFSREMKKQKLKMYCLFDTKKASEKSSSYSFIRGKVLPKGYDTESVVNIFGSKVAIVLWKEKNPTAFLIDSKEIALSFTKWFNFMWKNSK